MSDDRIPRNEAIKIVGKELFADAWVDDATPREMELLNEYKFFAGDGARRKQIPPELADEVYRAEMQAARAEKQIGDVMRWLDTRGFDIVGGIQDGFDRQAFNSAFAKAFGRAPPGITQSSFRHPTDAPLIKEAITALVEGKVSNALQAAELVYKRASGPSPEQNRDRLRKAVGKLWRRPTAKDRQS